MSGTSLPYDRLVAFAEGGLTAEQAGAVEEAIAASPELREELELIRLVLTTMRADRASAPSAALIERTGALLRRHGDAAAADETAWSDRLRRVLARLVFDSRREPALAGFRGSTATCQLAYETDSARLDLQIGQTTVRDRSIVRIRGQVTPTSTSRPEEVDILERGSEEPIDRCTPDARGRFSLNASAGEYDLVVRMSDHHIVVPGLEVG